MLEAPSDELTQRARQAEREEAGAAQRAAAAGDERASAMPAVQQRLAEMPQRVEAYAQLRKLDAADLNVQVRSPAVLVIGSTHCQH